MGCSETDTVCGLNTCINLSISCSKLPTGLVPNTLSNGGLLCISKGKLMSISGHTARCLESRLGGLLGIVRWKLESISAGKAWRLEDRCVRQCHRPLRAAPLQSERLTPKQATAAADSAAREGGLGYIAANFRMMSCLLPRVSGTVCPSGPILEKGLLSGLALHGVQPCR